MAQVLIRNLDDAVVARLKARAAAANTSLEQYLRDLIARDARPSKEETLALADEIRSSVTLKPGAPPPEEVIQAMRQERDEELRRALNNEQGA